MGRLTALLAVAAFALIGLNVARYLTAPAASVAPPASAQLARDVEAVAGPGAVE